MTLYYWASMQPAFWDNLPDGQALYEETTESLEKREAEAAARKAAGGMIDRPANRPTKKQRRQIHRFKDSS